jgi:hypothetical protein
MCLTNLHQIFGKEASIIAGINRLKESLFAGLGDFGDLHDNIYPLSVAMARYNMR